MLFFDELQKTDSTSNQNTCTCSGTTSQLDVACKYDFCEKCFEGIDLCGFTESKATYIDGNWMTNTACVQHTSGREDKSCLTSVIDYTTQTVTCTTTVGTEFQCGSSATTDDGSEYDVGIEFDCSNVANGYQINTCNYVPYTSTELPPVKEKDPLSFLLHDVFDSCTTPASSAYFPYPTLLVATLSSLWVLFCIL
jgi:hypothetical protein